LSPLAAQDTPTLRGLERIPSLEGRIRAIETFVDRRYYDAAGMMYSHSNWREERPFVASDFSAQDSTIPGPEPHAWLSYENSVMVAGLFLSAQCYRFEATGEAAALDLARRAFEAISANYALTENRPTGAAGVRQKAGIVEQPVAGQRREAGILCKPYYGQVTDHTSTEQHFWPVVGLYRYWKHAPAELRPRIAQMLREVSERWRRGYRINFFGETWDFEQSYPRAQRHMFSWAVMHRLAYEVTGCDEDGNVWAGMGWVGDGYDGVHVFAPDGTRIGMIRPAAMLASLSADPSLRAVAQAVEASTMAIIEAAAA
jgi:hypothetical protein